MPKQLTRSVVIADDDVALVERCIKVLSNADASMIKAISAGLDAIEAGRPPTGTAEWRKLKDRSRRSAANKKAA